MTTATEGACILGVLVGGAAATYAALPCPQLAATALLLACLAGQALAGRPSAALAAAVQLGAVTRLVASAALAGGAADTPWAAGVLATVVVVLAVAAWLHQARAKKIVSDTKNQAQ